MKTFVFIMRNGEQIEIVAPDKVLASSLAVERGFLTKDDFFDVVCIVESIVEKDWNGVWNFSFCYFFNLGNTILISFNIYFDQLKIARSKGRSFMYLYFVTLALFFISPFLLLLHLFSKKV